MLERLKTGLALISGWALAAALATFWFLSRRHSSRDSSKVEVEPEKVPDDMAEVKKELRKRGLLK